MAQVSDKQRPNILFFFTDDQRFDRIHALGNEPIVTPHMDALARDGTTFTNAYIMGGTCAAVCMPSRAMLMAGRTLFRLEGEGQGIPEGHVLLRWRDELDDRRRQEEPFWRGYGNA